MASNDDTVIYYHRDCGWVGEPIYLGAMVNQCPQCSERGTLSFVTYKRGTREEAFARRIIEREVSP